MSYLAIVAVVGLIIAIHELGHLLAAKACGIPIERYSVGFGPRLIEFKHGETAYWLSLIPLGGYVLPALDENEFRRLPLHKGILFALGGPLANVVTAYLALIALGRLAFNLSALDAMLYGTSQLSTGLRQLGQAIVTLLGGAGEITGIVGIVAMGGARFGSSLPGLLSFWVAISLNLAVLNLLPLPPLDGGRIAFAVLERIYRPLSRIQRPVTLAGWALMLALMLYATIHDLERIVHGALA